MGENNERRDAERIGRNEGVEVKIVECVNAQLIGHSFHCRTVDLSEQGLQLQLPEPLADGSVIEICISIQGNPCKFYLKGAVRHTRNEEGAYNTGVEFDSKPSADMMSWAELFSEG